MKLLVMIFALIWNNFLEKFLEDLAKKTDGKFDDVALRAIKTLVKIFLGKYNKQFEQKEGVIDYLEQFWLSFTEEIKLVDYKELTYNFYYGFLRKVFKRLVESNDNDLDDNLLIGLDKLIDIIFRRPSVKKIEQ